MPIHTSTPDAGATQSLGPADWRRAGFLTARNTFDTRKSSGQPYEAITWDGIATMAAGPAVGAKHEGPFCILSTYRAADARSHAAQRLRGLFYALALDVDTHTPKAALEAALDALDGGAAALGWWTSSASLASQRWRLLVPLAKPLPGSAYLAHNLALIAFMADHGVVCDAALARPGQPVYLPYRAEGAEGYDFIRREGHGFDVEAHGIGARARQDIAALAEQEAQDALRGTGGGFASVARFDRANPLADLLLKHGYTRKSPTSLDFRSPFQKSGSFATRIMGNGRWHSLSESDRAAGIGKVTKSGERCFGDAFDIWTHFEHGGDTSKALAAWKRIDHDDFETARARAQALTEKAATSAARREAATDTPPDTPPAPSLFAEAVGGGADEPDDDPPTEASALYEMEQDELARAEAVETADRDLFGTMPAGVLKDFLAACADALPMDMPELAVAAGLSGLSALTSGFVVVSPRAATPLQLWTVTAAPSGVGKSFAAELVSDILGAAGIHKDGMPNSKEGLHRAAMTSARAAGYTFEGDDAARVKVKFKGASDGFKGASAVLPIYIDELTAWMSGISKGNGKTGVADSAFGQALSLYNLAVGAGAMILPSSVASARDSRPAVYNPHLTLTCTTTPDGYLRTLNDYLIASGWGNRALHFLCDYRPADKDVVPLPDHMREFLREIPNGCWAPAMTPAQTWVPAGGLDWHRRMRRIDMTMGQVKATKDFEWDTMQMLKSEGLPEAIGGRVAEQAIKIAGIASVLEGAAIASVLGGGSADWPDRMEVTEAWLAWGLWLARRLCLRLGSKWQASNRSLQHEFRDSPADVAAKVCDLLRRMIRKGMGREGRVLAKLGMVSKHDLARYAHLSAFQFSAVIATLEAEGRVEIRQFKPEGRQREITCYRLRS